MPAREPTAATWTLYVLRCADGTLYTGIATDVERRLEQHNGERPGGARYTSGRRPVELVFSQAHPDRSAAAIAEAGFKRLSRSAKEARIGRR
jgi:putative endonuclease